MMGGGMAVTAAKSCIQCQQLKPAADFHIEARSSDGLTNKCKECRRIKQVCFACCACTAGGERGGGRP